MNVPKFTRVFEHGLMRNLRKNFEKTFASKSKTYLKPFWSYVKSKLKSRIKVPTKSDGTKAYNSREKADALNKFFGSVYKEELDNGPHIDDYSGVPLTSLIITHKMVIDGIHTFYTAYLIFYVL